ncbi:MAG TPA: uracil-DNA glycosylase family protein, partial [Candidatus Binatia bacterium]|nr:uracil-DNA glycosylase family protein [Candidatus Binatia bacterium]
LPPDFPESPVMFVGHNFDSIKAHSDALANGGEIGTQFWKTLKAFLRAADELDPADCFFTNTLMGVKPGGADGPMPDCEGYRPQCQRFLRRQIEIVRPRSILVLGDDAQGQLRKARRLDAAGAAIHFEKAMHPSTRPVNQRPNREQWIVAQGGKIAAEIATAPLYYASAGFR